MCSNDTPSDRPAPRPARHWRHYEFQEQEPPSVPARVPLDKRPAAISRFPDWPAAPEHQNPMSSPHSGPVDRSPWHRQSTLTSRVHNHRSVGSASIEELSKHPLLFALTRKTVEVIAINACQHHSLRSQSQKRSSILTTFQNRKTSGRSHSPSIRADQLSTTKQACRGARGFLRFVNRLRRQGFAAVSERIDQIMAVVVDLP